MVELHYLQDLCLERGVGHPLGQQQVDAEGNGKGKQKAKAGREKDLHQDHQGPGGLREEEGPQVQAVHDEGEGGVGEEGPGEGREGEAEEAGEGGDEGGKAAAGGAEVQIDLVVLQTTERGPAEPGAVLRGGLEVVLVLLPVVPKGVQKLEPAQEPREVQAAQAERQTHRTVGHVQGVKV